MMTSSTATDTLEENEKMVGKKIFLQNWRKILWEEEEFRMKRNR